MAKMSYTRTAEFMQQCNDPVGEAFRAMSRERERRYHPAQHFDVELDRLARSTARRAADELGIGRPAAVRWFYELDYSEPERVTLSGVAFPYYAAIYLNTGLKRADDVRWTAAHETAHLAGSAYDSEDTADGFAARFTGQQGCTVTRASGDDIQWLPSCAPVNTNYWELRTA
jgi:hypothetical protein